MTTLFSSKDPMEVLTNENSDGDSRVWAMQNIREPLSRGGSQAEQDAVLKILGDTAKADPQGMCRLAAVEALGRFNDPRCARLLTEAYYASPLNSAFPGADAPSGVVPASYAPDIATLRLTSQFSMDVLARIQSQTMESLGRTRTPEAQKLLLEVVEKNARRKSFPQNPNEQLPYDAEQYRFDVRLAAIRALRHYPDNPEVIEKLTNVVKTDRDTAMQNRAVETLKVISPGKDWKDPKYIQQLRSTPQE